jgi:OFA family oxalate/formate antiporter-like MFS transporter
MQDRSKPSGLLVLLATSLLSAVLGTVHTFSVFILPLQTKFDAFLGWVSLTYSIALLMLTLAVLLGHYLYTKLRPSLFALAVCCVAALGAIISGYATNLAGVWLGYGIIFGFANGLGYGFALLLGAQANPARSGFAIGIVTAAYAFGAIIAPIGFGYTQASGGFTASMLALAGVLIAVGLLTAILLHISGISFEREQESNAKNTLPPTTLILLWIGYGAAVVGGLMTIGHAAAITYSIDPTAAVWITPFVMAVLNLAGSLAAGRLSDRFSPTTILCLLPLLSATALLGIAATNHLPLVIALLGVVGFSYGGIIAACPATLVQIFGPSNSAKIYGRIFTAWGAAGFIAPLMAGFFFDLSQSYQPALLGAALLGLISCTTLVKFTKATS